MEYIAITQATCSWLLANTPLMEALYNTVSLSDLTGLNQAEFSAGPLRMAGSGDGRILAVWNRDYLSGTGAEAWGIFKLNGSNGINSSPQIGRQVFERTLFVINQRLQGLVLDSEFIHRPWPNGSHTCLAGRGTEARQYSIAYFEAGPGYADLSARAIFSIGPEHDFDKLQLGIEVLLRNFAPTVDAANKIVDAQRRRPVLEAPALQELRDALSPASTAPQSLMVTVNTGYTDRASPPAYESMHWTYEQWIASGTLNDAQRRVLNSDVLEKHPLRILGPAGSGKTLLMQLLAIRQLKRGRENNIPCRILFSVHNAPMAQTVTDRLRALGAEEFLTGSRQNIQVSTLSEYGRTLIGISESMVIDKDAQKTKLFQFDQVRSSLRHAVEMNKDIVDKSNLLSQARDDESLFRILSVLVMQEISSVIKGRGLTDDSKRYTNADAPLSRFHRLLSPAEREVVYEAYRKYNEAVFEQHEILDSDDIAISLAGRLRTPVWQLKRKTEGFDFVFVDEAQLFNENERRIFPYLTRGSTAHVPIALALDEAQEPFGFASAGIATLGIANAENEQLPSNHRSTKEIVDLAFFVIQRTTDLFGSEFPDFTKTIAITSDKNNLSAPPSLVKCNEEAASFARFITKTVKKLRAKNIRQIAVICHAEGYWSELEEELRGSELPLHVIKQRGEKISPDQPLVVLSRPAFIGGQEFDAVILVGLEQGLVPPRVADNPPLSAALEQQVLREIYLTVTRARHRVVVALNKRASPNTIVAEARMAGLLVEGDVS